MRFCVLGSGSKGNATYIATGKTAVLIDSGFSGVEVERRLAAIGVDIATLSAILVTHEHGDHIRGVPVLSRRYRLPVFANAPTFQTAGKGLDNLFQYQEFSSGHSFVFQDLHIHPFSVSHDAAEPVGFVVDSGLVRLGYCTDTGKVSHLMRHRLAGCHGLVLESNHDLTMLKKGPYPPHLQQRVRSNEGHLANTTAAAFLNDLLHAGLEQVVLAHISETNNHPEIVRRAFADVLQPPGERGGQDRLLPCLSLAVQNLAGNPAALKGERS